MKKNLLYGMILLAAVACNKETLDNNFVPQPGKGETAVRLTGEIAVPATKVEFDDVQGIFNWSAAGDSLAVHVTDGKRGDVVFVPHSYKSAMVVPNSPATTCDFYFVMSEAQTRDYYAIYPANIVDEDYYGNGELRVTLPSEYKISPAGMANWSPTPMVAVNDPSLTTLSFRHIGGLLRLTLNDVSPATASIEVSMGKRLTGSFTVNDPATSVPYIATDDNADVVTFNLSEPLAEYTDGLILNIPVPTGTYESLVVKAKDEDGQVIFSYEDDTERSFYAGRGRRAETVVSTVSIPLTFEALEDGVVTIDNPLGLTIEYSFNNKTWTPANDALIYIPFSEGECVYLRGNNVKYSGLDLTSDNPYEEGSTKISCDGTCYIYGNIMSLIDAENYPNLKEITAQAAFAFLFSGATDLLNHPERSLELPATTLAPACYGFMFQNCSGLVSAPAIPADVLPEYSCIMMFDGCKSLVTPPVMHAMEVKEGACGYMFENCSSLVKSPELPATTIGKDCYSAMFAFCTSLREVPEILPAATLAKECYDAMFYRCTSLSAAPELPATDLAEKCYHSMFEDCTSLTAAPELPATTLAPACYSYMFEHCASLTAAPELPAMDLAEKCYSYMFKECTSLTSAPELPATTLATECYSYMFQDCTSLTTAPVLPATTVATNSYDSMFYGCSNLNYVKAMFLTYPTVYNWLYNVAAEGTFVMNAAATWDPDSHRGINGIPERWTIETANE